MDAARLAARHRRDAPRLRSAGKFLLRRVARGELVVLALLCAAGSAALIGFLWLLGVTLARLVEAGGAGAWLVPALAGLVGLALLRAALTVVLARWTTGLGLRVTETLRAALLHRAMDPAWRLRHQQSPGGFATRLGPELDSIQHWYGRYLPAVLVAVIQPLLILLLVFPRDWLAGTLLALTAPLIPLFMALIGMGAASLAEDQHRQLARLGDHFLDRLRALPLLRLLRRTNATADEVEEAAHGWRRSAMRVLRVAFLSSAVLEFFAAVAIATVAIYVGMALLGFLTLGPAPQMTLTAGLVILLLAPEFFAPLRTLGQRYHDRAAALAATASLRPLLEDEHRQEPEPFRDRHKPRNGSPRNANHHQTNLRWARAPALTATGLRPALPGAGELLPAPVELHVEPGEWLAITGPSGSGKTSVVDALLGLLPRASGEIRLGGRLLEEIPLEERRANIAWLGQQARLLATSLKANIAPGEQTPSPERLQRAVELAGLEEVVAALPLGLETRLGEDGAGLSGGERRRLALARSLYSMPRLLVLDEPTAGLDAATEARVLRCLRRLAGECTLILCTHSEAAIAAADREVRLPASGEPTP